MANQGRKFLGILYPDSTTYSCEQALVALRSNADQWAYVLHDQDMDEATGQLKKPHYHWIANWGNPVQIKSVANRLEIPENHVEFCKNWKSACRYLIHEADPDKAQYPVDAVQRNFDFTQFFGKHDASLDFGKILTYITFEQGVTWASLSRWCLDQNLYSALHKNAYIISNILKERNRFLL